jgi:hypothetical protein
MMTKEEVKTVSGGDSLLQEGYYKEIQWWLSQPYIRSKFPVIGTRPVMPYFVNILPNGVSALSDTSPREKDSTYNSIDDLPREILMVLSKTLVKKDYHLHDSKMIS